MDSSTSSGAHVNDLIETLQLFERNRATIDKSRTTETTETTETTGTTVTTVTAKRNL